ncbi:MAG: putative DNA-binding domain-containing protein [Pseudomonadota bacterium]|nr:putative DNA-binding domain-containing protein [Pseudomonadota bacterium]
MLADTLSVFSSAVRSRDDSQAASTRVATILTAKTANNLSAYRRNHLYALLAILRQRYTAVAKFLGDDNFKFFAREYIYKHASNDPNIDNYGGQFAAFIKTRQELGAYVYLADLAQVDSLFYHAQGQCRVAKGVLSVWQAIIAGKQVDGLEVCPQDLRLVACAWRAGELYLIER